MRQLARHAPAATVLLVLAGVAGCSAPGASTAPTPTQVASPASLAPSVAASAAPSGSGGAGVVVTFRVADTEEYRILLTDPEDIAVAERLLAGDADEARRIPNGVIVRGGDGGVNAGYSWHIDPASVEFAELTIEVCDGLPSYVEDGSLSGDQFCPWSAEVIAVEPAG